MPQLSRCAVALSVLLASSAIARAGSPTFDRDVKPAIERYCLRCHGEAKPKGGIRLSRYPDGTSVRRDPELWRRVSEALNERTMPPEGKNPQIPEEERQGVIEAIGAILDASEEARDPGDTPIQRLTRQQYNNTIRDLLGVDTHPADAFPSDGGGGSGFDNNASTLFVPPILMEKYLAAAGAAIEAADPGQWRVAQPGEGVSDEDAARRCLERFASRAFRRPVTSEEVDRLLRLYRRAGERGKSFDDSVKLAMRAVLVSPNFLFLIEEERESSEPYRVSDFELATRLSYFLWSSMPDDTLTDLAAQGKLHEPEVLEGQVKRMLADPKSRALAESFAGQWLRVGSLAQSTEPDQNKFPGYTPELRNAMIEEPIAFFESILREDASILDLLDSDHTMANETLAKHYGLEGVSGPEFRRVELKDRNRGGVLGMAGVLTLTSYPQRTSPVLRGKWVLEELLGTPPPPPPPEAKVLPPDDQPKNGKSFRQRLEAHRKNPNCAACHAKLDPLGFGLENFDAIGRWRTEIGGEAVDSAGEMVTGEKFQGAVEMKKILVDTKKELFVRNLAQRMLSYAVRRGVEYYDATAVKGIIADLEAHEYRGGTLITAIVKSFPFQYRRPESGAGGKK